MDKAVQQLLTALALDTFPTALLPNNGTVVGIDCLKELRCGAFIQRKGAQCDYFVVTEFCLDLFLVGDQFGPMLIMETCGVAGCPQPAIAFADSDLRFLAPSSEDGINVEGTASQIPRTVRHDLHLAGHQVMVEFGDCDPECVLCLLDGKRIRSDPDAGFVGCKPFLEIGNEDFQQVILRLVEMTEMRSPRNTIRGDESCLAQPIHHFVLNALIELHACVGPGSDSTRMHTKGWGAVAYTIVGELSVGYGQRPPRYGEYLTEWERPS